LLSLLLVSGCQPWNKGPKKVDHTIRALWVTRWDYKNKEDISRIMTQCQSAGFNTVLFQVRGNGTVMYPSRLEPWAKELNERSPGFDPLKFACAEAHVRDLKLHAWVNVMPGWRGKEPPTNQHQLYNARPHWFWQDARGRRQPLGWYNSVNPCYPEVRRYLSDLMGEIVSGYDVDGLHMDYIRFPNEWNNSYPQGATVPDYPRDRRSLDMFHKATGRHPDSDPEQWTRWRADQVTQLVRDIRASVKRVDPAVKLSAAVGRSPLRAYREHFQHTQQWLAENLLDAVYPMNYESNIGGFDKYLEVWSQMKTRVPIVMGIMFDKSPPQLIKEQIDHTNRTGSHFAAFAYNSIYERHDADGRPVKDAQSASRASVRRSVVPKIRQKSKAAIERLAAR
jgi:uncharacterized lipoprotein YddW (UPF0748 family)